MKYIYRILKILIIIFLFIIPALADDIEWVDPQEKTLRLTEFVIRDGFIIEATDFYDNSSLITVYDTDRNIISKNVTRINDTMEVNERLNITIKNLQENIGNIGASLGLHVVVDQWVRIETRVAGWPLPRISIGFHEESRNDRMVVRRSFTPGSEISINFSVRNDGKAVLKDPILTINSSLPLRFDDKLYHELRDVKASNTSRIIKVRFTAPYVREKNNFTISAQVTGIDISGKTYHAADSINIEVKPQFEKRIDIQKYITEKIYMGDVAVVSLYIKNNESRKIENVTLEEALSSGLMPVNTNLSWNFSLYPLEQKFISYMVKPQKPGTYYFPPGSTRIEYQDGLEYDKKLNKLIVNGPYVVLSKSANIENPTKGDNITVKIEAKNQGNAAAIVKIVDSVPLNYSITSGNMSFLNISKTAVLRSGNSTSFTYTLHINDTGSFIIPQVQATVLDQFLYREERYIQRTASDNLTIKVKDSMPEQQEPVKIISTPEATVIPEQIIPEEINTPNTDAATPRPSSGFQGFVAVLLLIVIREIITRKSKRKI